MALLPVTPVPDDPAEAERAQAWLVLCDVLRVHDPAVLAALSESGPMLDLHRAALPPPLEFDPPQFHIDPPPFAFDPMTDVDRILRDLA